MCFDTIEINLVFMKTFDFKWALILKTLGLLIQIGPPDNKITVEITYVI